MQPARARFAFTLTEVLLAIVIVGVLAALVLPAVITHFQEKGFDQAYVREKQTIESALEGLAVSENKSSFYETMMYTTTSPETYTDTSEKFMKKYLRVSKIYGDNNGNCFGGKYYQYIDNDKQVYTPEFKGSCATLKNGASICMTPMIGGVGGKPISVLLDVNGLQGPNVLGKDLRSFEISIKDKLSMNKSTESVITDDFLIGEPECNSCDCNPSLPGCQEEEDTCDPSSPSAGCCSSWFNNKTSISDNIKDWCCQNDSNFVSSHHPGAPNAACMVSNQNVTGVVRLECYVTGDGVECHVNANNTSGWYVKKAGVSGSKANSSGSCNVSNGGQALGTYSCFFPEQFSISTSFSGKNYSCKTSTRACNTRDFELIVCRSSNNECKTGTIAVGTDSVITGPLVHDPSKW